MSARAGDVSLENAHDGARAFHGGAGACAAPILAHYPCAHVYEMQPKSEAHEAARDN